MSPKATADMMRIAIAGGGGFASILTQALSMESNAILVLSTRVSDETRSLYVDSRMSMEADRRAATS
jgi:hypothetical protein